MAVQAATRTLLSASNTALEDGSSLHDGPYGDVVKVTWAALDNNDSGDPIALAQFSDRSVQVGGVLGAGGTVVIEGSNDGVTYYTLNDAFGNALSLSSLGLKSIAEITAWIRPRATGGDGTTAIVITMLASR